MKKRGKIGIGVTVLVFSVILGIASIPDEVLEESSTFEQTQVPVSKPQEASPQITPTETQTVPKKPIEESEKKQESIENKLPPQIEIQSAPTPIAEPEISESNPNLIKIEISDGVGTGDI